MRLTTLRVSGVEPAPPDAPAEPSSDPELEQAASVTARAAAVPAAPILYLSDFIVMPFCGGW